MTVAQSRVVRVAAWVAAVVGGAVLLVLTFVVRGYYHRFLHPDLLHVLMYPVPAVVVVALLAGALVAGGLVYACVEGKGRSRTVAAGALALLPLALLVSAWVVVVGLTTDRAGVTRGPPKPQDHPGRPVGSYFSYGNARGAYLTGQRSGTR